MYQPHCRDAPYPGVIGQAALSWGGGCTFSFCFCLIDFLFILLCLFLVCFDFF